MERTIEAIVELLVVALIIFGGALYRTLKRRWDSYVAKRTRGSGIPRLKAADLIALFERVAKAERKKQKTIARAVQLPHATKDQASSASASKQQTAKARPPARNARPAKARRKAAAERAPDPYALDRGVEADGDTEYLREIFLLHTVLAPPHSLRGRRASIDRLRP